MHEFYTEFIYEDLDPAAFQMIEDALACFKELFPYALLFNTKLSSATVIDSRSEKKKSRTLNLKE